MSAFIIRPASADDRASIRRVEETAFGRPDEADLVERLLADGDVVLELVAERDGELRGHVVFSRLHVERDGMRIPALALAPLAVAPEHQGGRIGSELVMDGHRRLIAADEKLSVVLGDPAYYGRFGYSHQHASAFESDYQCDALQAVAFRDDAPLAGRLFYPMAFGGL